MRQRLFEVRCHFAKTLLNALFRLSHSLPGQMPLEVIICDEQGEVIEDLGPLRGRSFNVIVGAVAAASTRENGVDFQLKTSSRSSQNENP